MTLDPILESSSSQIAPASAKISDEIQKLAPSALIELFELTYTAAVNGIDQTVRYHAGTNQIRSNIVFGGKTYSALPVQVTGFDKKTQGTLPRPKLKVSNVNNALSAFIQLYNPLQGKVQRIQTHKKFLDDVNFPTLSNPTADSEAIVTKDDIWYIDRISAENPEFVEFELSPKINLQGFRIPRRVITEHCPWEYRGTECGYKGSRCYNLRDEEITVDENGQQLTQAQKRALDRCGHKYSSCQVRFRKGDNGERDLPFGGFINARIQI
tara:strand:+ start:2442 stop:3245 length:804 start_codon:yes stop_codon:yes gene_type:complete